MSNIFFVRVFLVLSLYIQILNKFAQGLIKFSEADVTSQIDLHTSTPDEETMKRASLSESCILTQH